MEKLRARPPEPVDMKYALGQRRSKVGECLICTTNQAPDGVMVDFKDFHKTVGFYCCACIQRLGRVLKNQDLR